MSGADEILGLARLFDEAAREVAPELRAVVQEGMADVKNAWIVNARATAGAHGKHYPDSITYETHLLAGGIVGEVGPDSAKPQGSMGRGFELGSRNQPPHLDGTRAVADKVPSMERRLDTAIGFLIP